MKNLNIIAQNDRDADTSLTEKAKAKIVQKYANANIKLAKILGCPFVGRFLHISGLKKDSQNEAFNICENLHIEAGLSTSKRRTGKIERTIEKYSRKKSLRGTEPKTAHVWTKTYTNFVKDVPIPDRRIEVNSLSESTVEKFKALAEEMPLTKDVGGCVQIFFGKSKEKQSYIRVADASYLDKSLELLLEDVKTACDENPAYRNQLFPLSIVKISYGKKLAYSKETVTDEHGEFKNYDAFMAKYNSSEKTK